MAMENPRGGKRGENEEGFEPGIGGMPGKCIAQILTFTTPQDVCRLTAVSQSFKSAAISDVVWEAMLPHNYRNVISRALNSVAFASKKELYFRLCDSILIDAGTKRVWLERSTGKLCYMLSARELTIAGGDDPRHWRWVSRDDSGFEQLAESVGDCRFEVRGRIECRELSPNTAYNVSFVLKFGHDFYSMGAPPVTFSGTTQYCGWQNSAAFVGVRGAFGRLNVRNFIVIVGEERFLEEYPMTPLADADDGWKEYVAGDFKVDESGNEGAYVQFSMEEINAGGWNLGMLVDGVKIQPKQSRASPAFLFGDVFFLTVDFENSSFLEECLYYSIFHNIRF